MAGECFVGRCDRHCARQLAGHLGGEGRARQHSGRHAVRHGLAHDLVRQQAGVDLEALGRPAQAAESDSRRRNLFQQEPQAVARDGDDDIVRVAERHAEIIRHLERGRKLDACEVSLVGASG